MAFDLDDEELRATRRDKGLDKDRSDKDVEQLKDLILDRQSFLIDEKEHDEIFLKDIKAIENILAEREQDQKRIQELEEENTSKQKAYDDCYCEYKHYKQFNSIPKQKVKDVLEDIEDYFERLNGPYEDIEYIRQIKQELLEGEK